MEQTGRKNELAEKPCILIPIGIHGHINLADALRRELGRPVVGISLSSHEKRWIEDNACIFTRHYCFRDFYINKKAHLNALDNPSVRAKIKQIENKWHLGSTYDLFFMDRKLIGESSYNRLIRLMCLYLSFADMILKKENVYFYKSALTNYFGLVLNRALVTRKVPSIKQQTARVNGRTEFIDCCNIGMLLGWQFYFSKYKEGNWSPDPKVKSTSREWLNSFRNKPFRPQYSKKNAVDKFSFKSLFKRINENLTGKFDVNYLVDRLMNNVDRETHQRARFGESVLNDLILRECRAFYHRLKGMFVSKIDLTEPFVYFPLQYYPELTTLTYNPVYRDQSELVCKIARNLPSGYRLYVKEHTSMLGRRPSSFYKRIKSYGNVTLIDPSVSTFKLIENGKATATINSSAGWEAFCLGKPVITFGAAFYKEFPNVLDASFSTNLLTDIENYINGHKANNDEIEISIAIYFELTSSVLPGDINHDVTEETVEGNAVRLAKTFSEQIKIWNSLRA